MKSFTLISGILITLLGVFFFANPTNLLAIVGWLFALVMLVSGVSSLMVYFKRDNENRSFFQLLQSIISIVFGIILLSTSAWVLSGVAVTHYPAWWLSMSQPLHKAFKLIVNVNSASQDNLPCQSP